MKYQQQSELSQLIAAFSLISDKLQIGRESQDSDQHRVLHGRLRQLGNHDEAEVAQQLKDYQYQGLFKTLNTLCEQTFQMERGLPCVDHTPIAKLMTRLLDLDALRCLDRRLKLPADERFDWNAIPASLHQRLGHREGQPTVDCHIHLGGALPPLYFWTLMMSGGLNLHSLKSALSEKEDIQQLKQWQAQINRARWLRLSLAHQLRQASKRQQRAEPFPHLEALDWLEPKNLDTTTPHEPFREVSYRLLRQYPKHPQEWPLREPLRTPAQRVGRRVHYGEGERRLLHGLSAITASKQLEQAAYKRCEQQLLEYIQIRNAYHRLMVHDEGTAGLHRFLESFGQRGSLSVYRKKANGRGGRRARNRKLMNALERNRMTTALNEQLTRSFGAQQVAAGKHRLEMRVSLPGKGSGTRHSLRAWLDGIKDHLESLDSGNKKHWQQLIEACQQVEDPQAKALALQLRTKQQTPSHVGLIFHFLKQGPKSEATSLMQARRLTWLINDNPELRPLIVGIDAAGKERSTEPRVFAPAYGLLQAYEQQHRPSPDQSEIRLGYSYHVGEDVSDYLVGLRHVEEVARLLLPKTGGRLGHGLILGETASRFYLKRGGKTEPHFGAYLLSLIWAWGSLIEDSQVAEAKKVQTWIDKLQAGLSHGDLQRCHQAMWQQPSLNEQDREPFPNEVLTMLSKPDNWKFARSENDLLGLLLPEEQDKDRWQAPITVRPDPEDLVLLQTLQMKLRQRLLTRRLSIEVNPSSNLLVGGYSSYGDLPYRTMMKEGLELSLNTDDPGMFMTSLPNEFAAMYQGLKERGMTDPAARRWLDARREDALRSTFLPIDPGPS